MTFWHIKSHFNHSNWKKHLLISGQSLEILTIVATTAPLALLLLLLFSALGNFGQSQLPPLHNGGNCFNLLQISISVILDCVLSNSKGSFCLYLLSDEKSLIIPPLWRDLRRGHVKILKRLSLCLSAEFWTNFLWLACLYKFSQ